jgi:ferredoxin
MQFKSIKKERCDKTLEELLLSFNIFASVENEFGIDYQQVNPHNIGSISYNRAKPVTPLKTFFLPVRENVTSGISGNKKRIIIGMPNCDVEAIKLLDEIYLDEEFTDINYRKRRENTILISSDCITVSEQCHCKSYGVNPYSTSTADLALLYHDGMIIMRILTAKGEDLVRTIAAPTAAEVENIGPLLEQVHESAETLLSNASKGLPDFSETGTLVKSAGADIWENYASKCVSCAACVTICPTCSCFLLIDKPGFEKLKQMDGCQYPGFERVAGGEDPLHESYTRFRNRFMCKYAWKPKKFSAVACTGCGRCIEACIGHISKNRIFMEMAEDR